MKVLIINGSPHADGNTARAIKEVTDVFDKNEVAWEIVQAGDQTISGCTGCRGCYQLGKCVIDGDLVNETAPKLAEADGVIIASPVYYASAPGPLITFLDRLFYSSRGSIDKTMKVGASITVARRGGLSATYDELNKYFYDWPVTYILYNTSKLKAYVGETTSFKTRMQSHLKNPDKQGYKKVLFIVYKKANKSTI